MIDRIDIERSCERRCRDGPRCARGHARRGLVWRRVKPGARRPPRQGHADGRRPGRRCPIARHALLISDNPATSTPRRIVTAPDGTADVRLRPGNYTVESDEPVAFNGKGYQWTQTIDITAGRRRGPRTDRRERGGRSRTRAILVRRVEGERLVAPPAAMEGQRRRRLDAGVARVGIRRRCRRPRRHEPTRHRQRIGGGRAAHAVRQSGGARPGGRSRAGCRGPLDRSGDRRIGAAGSARAARTGRSRRFADGQRIVAIGAPLRGQKDMSLGDVIRVEPHAHRRRLQACAGQHRRAGLQHRWQSRRTLLDRGRPGRAKAQGRPRRPRR